MLPAFSLQIKIRELKSIDEICDAASVLLKEIKDAIGDLFNDILSSSGEATLIFTIDDTGSMAGEIRAAKNIAKAIIDAVKVDHINYILSPYNDPG